MSIVHVSQVFVIALTATIKRATFDLNFWSLEREREKASKSHSEDKVGSLKFKYTV